MMRTRMRMIRTRKNMMRQNIRTVVEEGCCVSVLQVMGWRAFLIVFMDKNFEFFHGHRTRAFFQEQFWVFSLKKKKYRKGGQKARSWEDCGTWRHWFLDCSSSSKIVWKHRVLGFCTKRAGKAIGQKRKNNLSFAGQRSGVGSTVAGQVVGSKIPFRPRGLSSWGLWPKVTDFWFDFRLVAAANNCYCQLRLSQHTVFAFLRTQNKKRINLNRNQNLNGFKN